MNKRHLVVINHDELSKIPEIISSEKKLGFILDDMGKTSISHFLPITYTLEFIEQRKEVK